MRPPSDTADEPVSPDSASELDDEPSSLGAACSEDAGGGDAGDEPATGEMERLTGGRAETSPTTIPVGSRRPVGRRGAATFGAMSKPLGPYTPVVRAGDFVIVSGQGGMNDGVKVDGGVRAETTQTMANVAAQLATVGATLADVVKTTCFLTDMENFTAFNEAYAEAFGVASPRSVHGRVWRHCPATSSSRSRPGRTFPRGERTASHDAIGRSPAAPTSVTPTFAITTRSGALPNTIRWCCSSS